MAIILLVLAIVVIAGYWMYNSSKPKTPTGNTNSNTAAAKKEAGIPANAPAGATPPNMSGSPSAPVVLEEFADFQCPQCALKHPVMSEIKSLYGSRIKFIFRNYPLDIPSHDKNYDAAVAAEAAGMQGKFWDMQNMLFTNQNAWSANPNYKQLFKDYAQKIGLDVNKWQDDMIGMGAKTRVDEDKKRAQAIGISGTPSLFINNQPVSFDKMTVEGLKPLIDAELAKAQGGGAAQTAAASNSNANSNTAK